MQQKEIEQNIQALVEQGKRLELDVTQKRKKLTDARANFKDEGRKRKRQKPLFLLN
jgi:regulator of replication initiation timing